MNELFIPHDEKSLKPVSWEEVDQLNHVLTQEGTKLDERKLYQTLQYPFFNREDDVKLDTWRDKNGFRQTEHKYPNSGIGLVKNPFPKERGKKGKKAAKPIPISKKDYERLTAQKWGLHTGNPNYDILGGDP